MQKRTAPPARTEARAGQVVFSPAARSAILNACRRGKRQAVLLSWPAGATYLPQDCYQPGEFDVVVGHVAGCPIYADVRRLALFAERRVLVDAEQPSRTREHPPLRVQATAQPQITGRPGRRSPGSDAIAGELVAGLVDELAAQFLGTYRPDAIWSHVRRAISDLRGSVSREALPEMAVRLAHHRLAHNVAVAS
jgi:hypothetical protein